MNSLRVLIVDDEPLARERLAGFLAGEPGVEIAGECTNGPEAIEWLRRAPPDAVFLDVQMPGCDGLQVVAALPEKTRPAVVFVTAHDRFAVEAFAVQAVDFLLKPFDRERFRSAIGRVRAHLRARRSEQWDQRLEALLAQETRPAGRAERLVVKVDGRVVFVRPEEIVWVEAADNYVVLHLTDGRLMTRETLSAIEDRLGPERFSRVNRSALVNLEQVRELQPTLHGDYTVVLRDGTKLPLSRGLRGQFGMLGGEAKA